MIKRYIEELTFRYRDHLLFLQKQFQQISRFRIHHLTIFTTSIVSTNIVTFKTKSLYSYQINIMKLNKKIDLLVMFYYIKY